MWARDVVKKMGIHRILFVFGCAILLMIQVWIAHAAPWVID